jgi:uncharacterized protein (TIGR02246 family)
MNRRTSLTLTTMTLFCALAAPAFAQDAKAIAEMMDQKWLQAYNAGDAAAYTALYTKDAALLPSGVAQPLIGESSIRKFYDEFVKQRAPNLSNIVTEAKMLTPDSLFMAGTYALDAPGLNGGAARQVSGTFLAVFVREGSDWRFRANAWNEMPPQPAK